ncbi:hypothetical protein GQ55_3G305300 [Panicum hallii var. hallii]|uniref:Pentatricopeptide repeat-containing protein n=1 Tax=Panicum hallii var. hallii TaxID=1504633 RepID=A0A2T7EEZ6_9POAL|nr:hypothetical protein GQ55_3G305300 [Panicum hallii var. hallii]
MESDIFIANSMMDTYEKFGFLEKASAIFEKIDAPIVVPWNAMIANLAQNGAESEAFRLFIEMQKNGKCPNAFHRSEPASSLFKGGLSKHGEADTCRELSKDGHLFHLLFACASSQRCAAAHEGTWGEQERHHLRAVAVWWVSSVATMVAMRPESPREPGPYVRHRCELSCLWFVTGKLHLLSTRRLSTMVNRVPGDDDKKLWGHIHIHVAERDILHDNGQDS